MKRNKDIIKGRLDLVCPHCRHLVDIGEILDMHESNIKQALAKRIDEFAEKNHCLLSYKCMGELKQELALEDSK